MKDIRAGSNENKARRQHLSTLSDSERREFKLEMEIHHGMKSRDSKTRAAATLCYLISKLEMRVGDETDEDINDIMIAFQLRVKNVRFHEGFLQVNVKKQDGIYEKRRVPHASIEFDYLLTPDGYLRKRLPVTGILDPLPNCLREFTSGKNQGDLIFDEISQTDLERFLVHGTHGITLSQLRTLKKKAREKGREQSIQNNRFARAGFEEAVREGVDRACSKEEIVEIENMAKSEAGDGDRWTDPNPQWRAFRRAVAEHIALDLEGEEKEPSLYSKKISSESTGETLNEDGHLYDELRIRWRECQKKYANVTVDDILRVLPFKEIRAKRESQHRTDIEALVEQALIEIGENYRFEATIDFFHVDFVLPDHRIVIECDGEYWHSSDRVMGDMKKTAYLESKGWQVYRIRFGKTDVKYEIAKQWVSEILNGNESREQFRPASSQQPLEVHEMYHRALEMINRKSEGRNANRKSEAAQESNEGDAAE